MVAAFGLFAVLLVVPAGAVDRPSYARRAKTHGQAQQHRDHGAEGVSIAVGERGILLGEVAGVSAMAQEVEIRDEDCQAVDFVAQSGQQTFTVTKTQSASFGMWFCAKADDMVYGCLKDSPCAKTEVAPGDTIVAWNGHPPVGMSRGQLAACAKKVPLQVTFAKGTAGTAAEALWNILDPERSITLIAWERSSDDLPNSRWIPAINGQGAWTNFKAGDGKVLVTWEDVFRGWDEGQGWDCEFVPGEKGAFRLSCKDWGTREKQGGLSPELDLKGITLVGLAGDMLSVPLLAGGGNAEPIGRLVVMSQTALADFSRSVAAYKSGSFKFIEAAADQLGKKQWGEVVLDSVSLGSCSSVGMYCKFGFTLKSKDGKLRLLLTLVPYDFPFVFRVNSAQVEKQDGTLDKASTEKTKAFLIVQPTLFTRKESSLNTEYMFLKGKTNIGSWIVPNGELA